MDKIKAWIGKYSKELLVGVVVSVLTTWIIKGFEWVKDIVPVAGNSVLNAFLSFFYSNLANMSDSSLISLLLHIALAFYIVFLLNTVLKSFSTSKEKIQIGKEIKNAVELAEKGELSKEYKEKSKKKTLNTIKNDAEAEIKDGKKLKAYAIVVLIFVVLYFFYILAAYFVPNIIWEVYNRDIVEIKPYVELQEIQQIESDWVCMKTKEDYDAIYKYIDEVKGKNNLP